MRWAPPCARGRAPVSAMLPKVLILMDLGFYLEWISTVGLDQPVEVGAGMGSGHGISEQPALAPEGARAAGVFALAVADRPVAVFSIAQQLGPLALQVLQDPAQQARVTSCATNRACRRARTARCGAPAPTPVAVGGAQAPTPGCAPQLRTACRSRLRTEWPVGAAHAAPWPRLARPR